MIRNSRTTGPPPRAGQEIRASAGWALLTPALAWLAADAQALGGLGGMREALLLLCCGAAVGAGFVVCLVVTGAGSRVLRALPGLSPRWRSRLAALPFALAIAWGFWWTSSDLFSGPWISVQVWRTPTLVGVVVLGSLAAWWGCARVARVIADPIGNRASTRMLVLAGVVSLPALAWADRTLLPAYMAFHLALSASFVVVAGTLGILLGRRLPRTAPVVAVLALLLAASGVLVLATGQVRRTDPQVRAALMLRAPFTARLLLFAQPTSIAGADEEEVTQAPRLRLPRPVLQRHFQGRGTWNLVLVTLDALRADHVSGQGYDRQTTPNLDAFARDAVVFENAYVQYPSSQLSMASMFTGLYASATSMARLRFFRRAGTAAHKERLLAQRLSDAGFRTLAITAFDQNQLERLFWYLPMGFDSFSHGPRGRWLDGDEVADRTLEAVSSLRDERYFLWVHLFDPHEPYARHEHTPGSSEMDAYDGEIMFADAQMQRVLAELQKRPDWNRTVVVVHSDHGEEFREHGRLRHNSSVFEEQVHVPLVIRIPGAPARRVHAPVEMVDLPATIEELFSLQPLPRDHGHSLLAHFVPQEAARRASVRFPPPFAFTQLRNRNLLEGRLDALRYEDRKLIYNPDADIYRLFDLGTDRGEKNDLAFSSPDVLATLLPHLARCRRMARPARPGRRVRTRDSDAREEERVIAAGLRGDRSVGPELHRIMRAPNGERRLDAMLALARLGSEVLQAQSSLLFEWGLLQGERALCAMEMLRGVRHPAYPFSCYVSPVPPHLSEVHARALLESTLAFGPAAYPLIRRALSGPDHALRERARAWLIERKEAALADTLLTAERSLSRARSDDSLAEARRAALGAYRQAARAGVVDWGIAYEIFSLTVAERGASGPAPDFEDVLQDSAGGDAEVTAFIARLGRVARSMGTPPVPRLSLGAATGELDTQPLVIVRLALADEGGSLPGGRGSHLPHISVAATPEAAEEHYELLSLPLPVAGFLPGEARTMAIPIPVESLPSGRFRVSILLNWGQHVLCTPLHLYLRK